MQYRIIDLDLSRPLPAGQTRAGELGVAVLARWRERPIGFALKETPPAAAVHLRQLRSWLAGQFARPALAAQLADALGARWRAPEQRPAPSLTVAICTKDRADSLVRLLASLETVYASTCFIPLEVLVVENGAADPATRAAVARFAFVRRLHEPRTGLNFARNAALHAATGDLIAFLDDDVVIDRYWLRGLHRAWLECPRAGGFTGAVLPLRLDTPAQVAFERRGGFGRGFERIHHAAASLGNPLHPVGAGVVGAGCNMVFRRALLLELGGFDEALDTGAPLPGGGDLDIFYRVLRSGSTIVYEPSFTVFHDHRATMQQLRRQYWSWGLGFMAFLTKAQRTDTALAGRHRAMLRWWFLEQARQLGGAVLRGRLEHGRFALAELRGGVRGLLGEYDRSRARSLRIREHAG